MDAWPVSIGTGIMTGQVTDEFLRSVIENELVISEIKQRIESVKRGP